MCNVCSDIIAPLWSQIILLPFTIYLFLQILNCLNIIGIAHYPLFSHYPGGTGTKSLWSNYRWAIQLYCLTSIDYTSVVHLVFHP